MDDDNFKGSNEVDQENQDNCMNTPSKKETSNDKEDSEKISESMSCWVDPEKVLQLAFTKIEEADKFYIDYATSMGFNVRRSHLARRSSGVVKNRELVCSREGFRAPLKEGKQLIRQPKPETRCGCQARIRFAHDITDGLYKVTAFNPYHNHALETPDTARVLKVNRIIGAPTQVLLDGLTSSGIKTGKAIDYLEYLDGGPGKLPFRRKDCYNYLNK